MTGNEKKTLRLKPRSTQTETGTTTVRRSKKRVIRREDIPSEKLTTAKPPKHSSRPSRPEKKLTPAEQQAVNLTQMLAKNLEIWACYKPLAIGVQDALREYCESIEVLASKRVLHRVLWHHTHQKEYLQQILEQPHRFHLDGSAANEITAAEKEHAQRTLDEINAEKKPARPPSD